MVSFAEEGRRRGEREGGKRGILKRGILSELNLCQHALLKGELGRRLRAPSPARFQLADGASILVPLLPEWTPYLEGTAGSKMDMFICMGGACLAWLHSR